MTNGIAKPAVPVLDVPLGAWGLGALLGAAPPVVVNASHAAAGLESALRGVYRQGWELFDEGPEGLGTAGTVAALRDRIETDVVVHNGDLIADIDIAALRDLHRASGAGITVAVAEVDSLADMIVGDGRVEAFVDRRRENVPGARYVGVAVISARVAADIPDTKPLGLGESVFAPLARAGELAAFTHRGYALDVGSIERYLRANLDQLREEAPTSPVGYPGRVVEVEGGRAYIGPGAAAAEGTLGSGAVLLRGAEVKAGAHVANAVVFENEVVTDGHEIAHGVWFEGRLFSS